MNRTSDGRFIDDRVRISKNRIQKILKDCKTEHNFTWFEFAERLNISEHTLRNDWSKKGNTVPLSIFKEIIKLHPSLGWSDIKNEIKIFKPFWGQKVGKSKYTINLPLTNSASFSEFYGIMLGDGCIYSNLRGFCISSDSLTDADYTRNYVSKLIVKLFGIEPKIYISNQTRSIRCVVYNKKICKFLVKIGFPVGKKINSKKLTIPQIFFKDKKLLISCIRGLQDTDGTICPHPHTKIMLQTTILNKQLLKSCINAYEKLNMPFGYYNKGINIYGKKKLEQYFSLIGSSNLKHILKYRKFITNGYVPNQKETETFLREDGVLNLKLPYMGSWSSG